MGTFLKKIGTGNVYDYWLSWTENWQSIDSNVTNLTVKLYLKRNDGYANSSYRAYNDLPISLSVDGGAKYSTSKANIDTRNSKTVELASWTGNISHNADGTRSVALEGYFKFPSGTTLSGAWTISTTITLTTIPRASSPSCITYPNHTQDVGNIGDTITIHMNRASSNFTHTVSYSWASKNATIGTGVTDNVAWTIPMDFCSDIPAAAGGWGSITVVTYSGSTYVGSNTVWFYAHVPSSVKPTISAVSISEATAGLAAKFGGYVLSKSTLAVSVTAGGAYGSAVTGCETSILGVKYSGTSFTSNALSRSGTVDVTVTVYDTRGASCTQTEQISVMDYAPPTISEFSAWRIDEDGNASDQGERLAVKMSYTVSSLDGKNNRTYDLKYGVSGNALTSFSTGTADASYSGTQTFTSSPAISADNSYVISLALSDYFGTSIETASIPTGFVLWDNHGTGRGVAFGKVSEKDEFECALPAEFSDAVTMTKPAQLAGGQWVHEASGTPGTQTYVKFAEITIFGTYVNIGFSFDIIQRGYTSYPSRLSVMFAGEANADPGLAIFEVYGWKTDYWIKKESTSTWGLYAYKVEGYDRIDVVGFTKPSYPAVNVKWVDEAVDNIDGATAATISSMHINVDHAGTADTISVPFVSGATEEGTTDTLMDYFRWKPSSIGTYFSSASNTWYNAISCRHRNGQSDGSSYGLLLYNALWGGDLKWQQQTSADTYGIERIIWDSGNSYQTGCGGGNDSGYIRIWRYQICWGAFSVTINVNTATGSSYYGEWTGDVSFAQPFASSCYPNISLTSESTLIKSIELEQRSSTGIQKILAYDSLPRTSQQFYVHYIACGLWC